jgi:hypothetical protein
MAALMIGAVTTLTLTWRKTVAVGSPRALHHVHYGWPFGWVTQDDSILQPSTFPHHTTMDSPWRATSHFHPGPVVLDLAVWSLTATVAFFVLRKATTTMSGLRQRRNPLHTAPSNS